MQIKDENISVYGHTLLFLPAGIWRVLFVAFAGAVIMDAVCSY